MAKRTLWARVGMSFEIEELELKKVEELIQSGNTHDANDILWKAWNDTHCLDGESYIPDNDDCTGGCDSLLGYNMSE